ncbi:MAG: hypothetical protein PHU25_20705 [Deltaproteobacteria bacterium]|nr:hypothetical protein [Deltaproteobacteria bacterium]
MMKTLVPVAAVLGIVLSGAAAAAQEQAGPETTKTDATDVDTSLPMGPILLGSFGVVTVAVGAGFGWQADEENDDFNKTPTKALADDVEMHALVADVLMFGGGALVLGGVLWWLLSDSGEDAPEQAGAKTAHVEPVVGPGRIGLTAEF